MTALKWLCVALVATNIFTGAMLYMAKSAGKPMALSGTTSACCADNCYAPTCTTSPAFTSVAAYTMVSNYRKNHWMAINEYCPPFNNWKNTGQNQLTSANPSGTTIYSDPTVKNDARSAWYNLDTLKQFINTIETMTCQSQQAGNCPTKIQLGIRIYYAEYPSDSTSLDTLYGIKNQGYLGMHTLLMVPTYNDPANQIDIDFDPFNFTDQSCMPKSVFATMDPIAALPPTTTINARNHGGLIPPPYRDDIYWSSAGAAKGAQLMWWVDYVSDHLTPLSPNRIQ